MATLSAAMELLPWKISSYLAVKFASSARGSCGGGTRSGIFHAIEKKLVNGGKVAMLLSSAEISGLRGVRRTAKVVPRARAVPAGGASIISQWIVLI
jgi:hypothetical protein